MSTIEVLDETRKYLTKLFENNFLVSNPNVPVRYTNGKFDPEDVNKTVIGLTEQPVTRISSQVGGKTSRYFGAWMVDATSPKNKGTQEARQFLSQIEDIYWQHIGYVPNTGYLHVVDIDYKEIQEFRGFHTLTMIVNYRLEACK